MVFSGFRVIIFPAVMKVLRYLDSHLYRSAMHTNEFENQYQVRYYETGLNCELHITTLMCYFEEVALLQSESRNVGLQYYNDNNVIWILNKWNITIQKAPVFGQVIRVKTLPVSLYGFMGYRKYWVFDQAGSTLATADSAWIFLNSVNKRPLRINDDMKRAYGHNGQPESKLEMPAVPAINNPMYVKELEVLKADIDLARHAHNTRYVHWALETLPDTFQAENRLINLTVEYKKETTLGQAITTETELVPQSGTTLCVHRITAGDKGVACVLSTLWEPRKVNQY
jgi:medium-chain acyl-[acyl-carrier-protein] hydrolase